MKELLTFFTIEWGNAQNPLSPSRSRKGRGTRVAGGKLRIPFSPFFPHLKEKERGYDCENKGKERKGGEEEKTSASPTPQNGYHLHVPPDAIRNRRRKKKKKGGRGGTKTRSNYFTHPERGGGKRKKNHLLSSYDLKREKKERISLRRKAGS